jgi:hypothetical protein
VVATGGTLTYQWQVSVDNASWSNITGSTAATAVLGTTASPVFKALSGWYRVVVSNAFGSVNSSSVQITIKGIFDFESGDAYTTPVVNGLDANVPIYEVSLNRLLTSARNDQAVAEIYRTSSVTFSFYYIGPAWMLYITVDQIIQNGLDGSYGPLSNINIRAYPGPTWFNWNTGVAGLAGTYAVTFPVQTTKTRVYFSMSTTGLDQLDPYKLWGQFRAAFRCMSHPTFSSS